MLWFRGSLRLCVRPSRSLSLSVSPAARVPARVPVRVSLCQCVCACLAVSARLGCLRRLCNNHLAPHPPPIGLGVPWVGEGLGGGAGGWGREPGITPSPMPAVQIINQRWLERARRAAGSPGTQTTWAGSDGAPRPCGAPAGPQGRKQGLLSPPDPLSPLSRWRPAACRGWQAAHAARAAGTVALLPAGSAAVMGTVPQLPPIWRYPG